MTAYWRTEAKFMSELTTMFAMLRWTKISPGCEPTMSSAGTRESEQPTHRYLGACFFPPCSANHACSDSAHFSF